MATIVRKSLFKTCSKCGMQNSIDEFLNTKSGLYADGKIPICNDCLRKFSAAIGEDWYKVNRLCQWIDIPFIPAQWEKISKNNPKDAFLIYAKLFQGKEYCDLNWHEYYKEFKELEEKNELRSQLPLFDESRLKEYQATWGENYSPEQLTYLQNLFDGMLRTQNINGELQYDQAKKLCKISLNIEERIRGNADFDKLLGSYEKLIKVAEFTPKNIKNACDFDSVGELYAWLEKRGWKPTYYTKVKQDIVDQTITDIQNFCQKLYVNEPSMGEEITKRIESLQHAQEIEDNYGIRKKSRNLDDYDADLADQSVVEEEFQVDIE